MHAAYQPQTLVVQQPAPNPPSFFGAATLKAKEVDYRTWRQQVLQLVQDNRNYPLGKIRSSLTDSVRVLTQHCTTFEQIMDKLDVVYLLPEDATKMQKDLFTSKQQVGESTQGFYVRMEGLRQQIYLLIFLC